MLLFSGSRAAIFAAVSAVSFPLIPTWAGIHTNTHSFLVLLHFSNSSGMCIMRELFPVFLPMASRVDLESLSMIPLISSELLNRMMAW